MNGPSEEGEEYRVHNQTDKEERAGGGGKRKRGVSTWNMPPSLNYLKIADIVQPHQTPEPSDAAAGNKFHGG
ncbi:hypothetical protein RRG08_038371 [Elysia crispata]|uniref:Uncharacterized protein n=1 Tax=Elysia crispata TaxID=231223 RepID=A0AAE1A8X7_9GAST|nr:hypothetical protein RRG08_038371 [Elysia crispata]